MSNNVLYVGLAVHKNSIDVALTEAGGLYLGHRSGCGARDSLKKTKRKGVGKGKK
jgi:hypothetical protein